MWFNESPMFWILLREKSENIWKLDIDEFWRHKKCQWSRYPLARVYYSPQQSFWEILYKGTVNLKINISSEWASPWVPCQLLRDNEKLWRLPRLASHPNSVQRQAVLIEEENLNY